jgi:hypothetical protein
MIDFKAFVATQVGLAQAELEQLFLLHDDEIREDVIPASSHVISETTQRRTVKVGASLEIPAIKLSYQIASGGCLIVF